MANRDFDLWLRYSSVGLELAVAVFLFTYGGYLLDVKTGMTPLFTSVGALIGMVIGFYNVYRSLFLAERKRDSEKNGKPTGKD